MFSRSLRPPTHSRISSRVVPEAEALPEHGGATLGGSAIFLHQDSQAGLEYRTDSLPEEALHLPTIFSQEEVARLIDAARPPLQSHSADGALRHGTPGAELGRLKVSDVDSQRMVIHVQGAKAAEIGMCLLSPKLLDELRQHWRRLHRKPSVWLFPSRHAHGSDRPITPKAIYQACEGAARTGCPPEGRASAHAASLLSPRICSKRGADLRTIQILLGHRDLKETTLYLHLSQRHLHATASPLDSLKLKE